MATIIYSDKKSTGKKPVDDQQESLMLGIGDKRDRNTHVQIILGIGCDDIQTYPDDDTYIDEGLDGSKLTIREGTYGEGPGDKIEIFSLEPLGVLKWLDDIRGTLALVHCG